MDGLPQYISPIFLHRLSPSPLCCLCDLMGV
uniref:Uncharacterized protein n=1 Tax=Arundo donax TaxID=35708 RepID=A0A0A9HWZ8_ARUDO